MMADNCTILPSSPLSLCEDRFSILPSEDDNALVPVWSIVVAVLGSPTCTVDNLMDHLETFAICIHGRSSNDFSHLHSFLKTQWDTPYFLNRVYPALVSLALELPNLFPTGVLPVLSSSSPFCILTRRQVACLVVHQFFCTLASPPWHLSESSADFHIWYAPSQSHPRATHAYLHALFTYFERLTSESWRTEFSITEWPITLTLHSSSRPPLADPESRFSTLTVCAVPTAYTHPSLLGVPSGACVISANKYIGFGRTGTQEETHVGCSPEACPTLLFIPPLQDNQVLVLEGVEAIITIEGYGRGAALGEILTTDYNRETYQSSSWIRRTMLFMDALELDLYDGNSGLADLLPGHLERELTKAYTAFSSREGERYSVVMTGLWGCGAFGGNAEIKTTLQWCAASIANVPLTFVCQSDEELFLDGLRKFSNEAVQQGWTVADVLSTLRTLHPEDGAAPHAFGYISERLSKL